MGSVRWLHWPDAPKGGGAADYFKAGGTVEGLQALVRDVPPWLESQQDLVPFEARWNLISSTDLARLELPEPKWAVPGIVPEGVLLVAGKPKFGKSWWVLDLCVAICTGGNAWGRIGVERGEVLYISFEDTFRRLQDRQHRLIGHEHGIPGLDYVTDCPRSDEGGVESVLAWVKTHPRARLIVIDPLEHWRPLEQDRKQLYRQDYDSLRPIVDLARTLGISVIVVHHCNKMVNPDDPFDAISGTTGLQGVTDAVGVFRREHGMADAVLFLKGKDVDFAELAFKGRIKDGYPAPAWELLGSGHEYRMTRERFETLDALWREPWQTPRQLAELMDPPLSNGAMRKRLFDMAHDGLVRMNDGKYAAGMDRDTYLVRFGHVGNDLPPTSNGNASNASNAAPAIAPPESVTSVPGVPIVTSVTGVTEPSLRNCKDCGGELPHEHTIRCESCTEARKPINHHRRVAPGEELEF